MGYLDLKFDKESTFPCDRAERDLLVLICARR